MVEQLRQIIADNNAGRRASIPSVCSAHPDVLRASLRLAQSLDRPLVVEATSNQVNQFGGYTGMTPADFVTFVHRIADDAQIDRDRLIFGGDHLGPQAWRAETPEVAMTKAHDLIAAYVAAGFRKIHLDCSEGCKGEASQLPDEVCASRSAALAETAVGQGGTEEFLFVVGTEVPPPGGARQDEAGDIPATKPEAAQATLAAHMDAFGDLSGAIGGLVVQPGVEFSPMTVHHLPLDRDPGLRQAISDWPKVTLEAHSTDYQNPRAYRRLAELGFAFQKVGPALTFAFRQAVFALDAVRRYLGGSGDLPATMLDVMQADPKHWSSHYAKTGPDLHVQCLFGLADRMRYYWPHPAAQAALRSLFDDLDQPLPEPMLWQVFAPQVLDRAETLGGMGAQHLVEAQIQLALEPYFWTGQAQRKVAA